MSDLGQMSESQLVAVAEVAEGEWQRRQWSQDTELLAAAVDLLRMIAARLDVGMPTVLVKSIDDVPDMEPIHRPEWVQTSRDGDSAAVEPSRGPSSGEVVMSPRDFARYATRR